MIDVREFRRACYDASRRTGGSVIEFRYSDDVTPNFHQGIIAYRDRTIAVVCERDVPLMAVAVPRIIDFAVGGGSIDPSPLTFVDAPDVVAVLAEQPGFRTFTKSELDGPFDAAAWDHIYPRDIKYWKPSTLGEALFNYWD